MPIQTISFLGKQLSILLAYNDKSSMAGDGFYILPRIALFVNQE